MRDYQKINTLFKRDEKNVIIVDEYSLKEFEYLENNIWECTEKIDGANIHIDIDFVGKEIQSISFNGRTENAEIPEKLLEKLKKIIDKDKIARVFNDFQEDQEITVSLYGEGYGLKIQKGGNYIKDDVGFILFDIRVGHWWLSRQSCESIAGDLDLEIVPIIGYMNFHDAINLVNQGFKSTISQNKDYQAEGLVLKTPNGLLFRGGSRIITKLKTVDFVKLKNKQS